jgi:intermediate peptidase
MVGRTEFQSVAGTRCATDFVELPSVLMESFAASPAVLQTFARHHTSDAPLPLDQLDRLTAAQGAFSKLATNTQILMAAVDQAYHAPLSPGFSSTRVLYDVSTEFSALPPVPGVAWQTRFTHLTSYGASYYAYLFDRAIAGQVWRRVFARDPLDRRAGERYKATLLRHGAGRDPWECVGELLQDDRVARGDERAMALVGEWGVEGDADGRQ